jgi:hypothetical protein
MKIRTYLPQYISDKKRRCGGLVECIKGVFKFFLCVAVVVAVVMLVVTGVTAVINHCRGSAVYKTIKSSDKCYVIVKDNRTEVSSADLDALKATFKCLSFDYDGDEAYSHCGFSDDFAVEFINSDKNESTLVRVAWDGDGELLINGNYYDIAYSLSDFQKIVKKYGMRDVK